MGVSNEFRPYIKSTAFEPILTILKFIMRTRHLLILYPYPLNKGICPGIERPRMTGERTCHLFPHVENTLNPTTMIPSAKVRHLQAVQQKFTSSLFKYKIKISKKCIMCFICFVQLVGSVVLLGSNTI